MTVYDVGDIATISTTLVDANGQPIDADVTLTITHPATATTLDPSPLIVDTAGTGNYAASFVVTMRGIWHYTWTAAGTVTAVDSGDLIVTDRARLQGIADYIDTPVDDPLLARLSIVADDMIADHLGDTALTVPLSIRDHAVMHLTSELYSRRGAPGGVLWSPGGGDTLARLNRDVMASVMPILAPYTAGVGIA
jgi:hypothetical protein